MQVEGRLKVCVKSGNFKVRDDLYVKVLLDERVIWKTEQLRSNSPSWNTTERRHLKGDYDKIHFQLIDHDTFSRDDLLGSCCVPIESLMIREFAKLEKAHFEGQLEMLDANGDTIGTLRASIEYIPGELNDFKLKSFPGGLW